MKKTSQSNSYVNRSTQAKTCRVDTKSYYDQWEKNLSADKTALQLFSNTVKYWYKEERHIWRLYKKLWRGTVVYERKSKFILFQTNYEHRDLCRNFLYTCFWDLLDALWSFVDISNKKTTMHNSHFSKLCLKENSSEVSGWNL